jgi:hypothetical protein
MRSEVGATVNASSDRLIGTAIGTFVEAVEAVGTGCIIHAQMFE